MPTTIRGEHSGLWGVYISTAQLPNASGATEQSVFLREGHLAITRISGTPGLYRCTTSGLGTATWEALGEVSAGAAYGGYHIASGDSAATANAKDVPIKLAGTTTLATSLIPVDFDMPADNRLRYIGTATIPVKITAHVSFTTVGSNQQVHFTIAQDGTPDESTEVHSTKVSGPAFETISTCAEVSMVTNSYVEVWCENTTGGGDITAAHLHLFAQKIT